jgi:hypothetical protein
VAEEEKRSSTYIMARGRSGLAQDESLCGACEDDGVHPEALHAHMLGGRMWDHAEESVLS